MDTMIIYDEMDRPYLCEVEGTRVIRVINGPKFEETNDRFDVGHLNDVRFGCEEDDVQTA